MLEPFVVRISLPIMMSARWVWVLNGIWYWAVVVQFRRLLSPRVRLAERVSLPKPLL